jgi:hypothetical protein
LLTDCVVYLKSNGLDPREELGGQVMRQLDRLKVSIAKLAAMDQPPQQRSMHVDAAAAKRFISHALKSGVGSSASGRVASESGASGSSASVSGVISRSSSGSSAIGGSMSDSSVIGGCMSDRLSSGNASGTGGKVQKKRRRT